MLQIHERRYCTCNVCITNTQILFTRGSVRVRKLGQTEQQRPKKHLGTSGAMPPETFWDLECLKYHFLHFGGVIWHNYENVIYIIHNLERTGEDESPQSPVAALLLFTAVTKILHSLTQTLLIVDALVCWSCHQKGHKARQCPKKRGTVYVPFSCFDVTFYIKLV